MSRPRDRFGAVRRAQGGGVYLDWHEVHGPDLGTRWTVVLRAGAGGVTAQVRTQAVTRRGGRWADDTPRDLPVGTWRVTADGPALDAAAPRSPRDAVVARGGELVAAAAVRALAAARRDPAVARALGVEAVVALGGIRG